MSLPHWQVFIVTPKILEIFGFWVPNPNCITQELAAGSGHFTRKSAMLAWSGIHATFMQLIPIHSAPRDDFSRMRSKGSRFTLQGCGGRAVFAGRCVYVSNRSQPFATVRNRSQPFATVRNRPQPFATVRVRAVWPCEEDQ